MEHFHPDPKDNTTKLTPIPFMVKFSNTYLYIVSFNFNSRNVLSYIECEFKFTFYVLYLF